jgi:hypothetical protein
MAMIAEQFNIKQTLQTSSLLKEIEDEENSVLKKVYNVKLVSLLEKQETELEVHAEFMNDSMDPKKLKFGKMEKGQFKRFMKKRGNPNDIDYSGKKN